VKVVGVQRGHIFVINAKFLFVLKGLITIARIYVSNILSRVKEYTMEKNAIFRLKVMGGIFVRVVKTTLRKLNNITKNFAKPWSKPKIIEIHFLVPSENENASD